MTTLGLELSAGKQHLRIQVQADSFEEAETRVRKFLATARRAESIQVEIVEVKHS